MTDIEELILSKGEWEKQKEFNFKENDAHFREDGSRIWERRIKLTDVKIFIEDHEPSVYYPYIFYINEKEEQKTERLVRLSQYVYTSFCRKNRNENEFKYSSDISLLVEFLKDLITKNEINSRIDDLTARKTKDMLEWLCKSIDLQYNLTKEYFPVPVVISLDRKNDKNNENIIVYSYQIIDISYTPKYLGECKYKA